jgi:hypothetical protein
MPYYGEPWYGEAYYGSGFRIPSGVIGPAMGDVILSAHGDRGRRPLQMSGIRASWEINSAGEFSAFCRLTDALAIEPEPELLRGWWIEWEHPTLGVWGGVVQDVAIPDSGTMELSARGWLSLLDKRITHKRNTTVTAHAGPIAARIVRDAGRIHPTGIAGVSADAWGDFVAWRDDGSEVTAAVRRLSDMSDQDFTVGEDDRIFYWRRRFGSDKTGSVQLVQGTHISRWRASYALAPVVTEVILAPNDRQRFARVPAVSGFDSAAYAAYGPRQQRGTIRGRLDRASARGAAQKQAEQLSRRGRLIELDVVDFDNIWERFRKGDVINVLLSDIDDCLAVRVLLMSWDQDSNLVRISAEIQ